MTPRTNDAREMSEAGLQEPLELGRKAPRPDLGTRQAARKQMPLQCQLLHEGFLQHATATPVCTKCSNGGMLEGCDSLLSFLRQDAELYVADAALVFNVGHTS